MKQTNRVFIFVIFILLVLVTGTSQLIQTERFGGILSKKVSRYIFKKYSATLRFDRIGLSLLPLSTSLVNLKFEKDSYYLNAGKVGLEFGLRDLFSKEFSIGRISIEESIVELPPSKKEQKESLNIEDIFKEYKSMVYTKLPFRLRGFEIRKAYVNRGDDSVEILDLEGSFFKNIFTIDFKFSFPNESIPILNSYLNSKVKVNGLEGSLHFTQRYFWIKSAKAFSDNSYIDVGGKYLYTGELKGGSLSSFINLNRFKKLIPTEVVNEDILPSGAVAINLKGEGTRDNYQFSGDFGGERLTSKFYNLDTIKGDLSFKNNIGYISNVATEISNGKIIQLGSTEIFDGKNKAFVYPTLNLRVTNMFSNDLMFFLPELDKAKFKIDGDVRAEVGKSSVSLFPGDDFFFSDFKIKGKNKNVLENPSLKFNKGSMLNINYNGKVSFKTQLEFPDSNINLEGYVDGKVVNAKIDDSFVNFKEFGPISGLEIEGRGPARGYIRGLLNDVIFNFNLNLSDFKTLNFNLGKINGDVRYFLKDARLELGELNGNYDGIDYEGGGSIDFDKGANALNMKFSLIKSNLEDSKVALAPIFGPLAKYLGPVQFNYSADLLLRGGLSVPQLNVLGNINASNIIVGAEDIESLKLKFKLFENKLSFYDLRGKKVSGRFQGEGFYHLGKNDYSYKLNVSNLRLKDIFYYRVLNLGLDGDVYGEFYGVGGVGKFSSRSHARVTNSSIENIKLNDSILTVYNNEDDLFFSSILLGGDAKSEGYINIGKGKEKRSSIKSEIRSKEVRLLSGIFSKHNINNTNIVGELNASLSSDFILGDWDSVNLRASVDDFSFRYPGVSVDFGGKKEGVEIENGVFKDWDLEIKGNGLRIKSSATGKLSEKFKLNNEFEVDSSVSELITDLVEKSQGTVTGSYLLIGSYKSLSQFLTVKSSDLSFKLRKLPGLFSGVNLDLYMEDDVLRLKDASGVYGNGKVKGWGNVKLKFPFPEVDLRLSVEKAKFPMFKKSEVVVSGDMQLTGKRLPYDLTGNLAIIQGEIVEEMNDLASSAISNDGYQRFIPVGYLEGNVSFINTDLRITSFSPMRIKNGMIDIGLGGNLRVFGSLLNPKVSGNLELRNQENKFLFKGHEFNLSEGEIKFVDGARKESPELKFSGVSRINDYDVYINLNGPADNLLVEMTSNPPLVQGDILSLLTLGVTSDVSRSLGDRQRQSITTLSIGSLLIDQLKINQSLNDSLGLRLSIQPEFIEDEGSLLEGRTEGSRDVGNRFRSSTVVKIQKRISKKVNLSVSSTLGGSVDQNQQMNVNYKINQKWSLEGVYEVRSNDELEQELPDSAGADVKYQWSF